MEKRNHKEEYKKELKAAFLEGFKIGSRHEALDKLSSKQADSLEKYVNSRISEINEAEGAVDLTLRSNVKLLITELEKIVIIQGNNLNKSVLNQIKEQI